MLPNALPHPARQLAVLFVVGFLAVFVQPGQGQSTSSLNFFKNYFIEGDYVVGGVGVRGTGQGGFATAALPMSGVPANADIVAAFLYWETVVTTTSAQGNVGAQFRGNDLTAIAKELNPAGTSPCWSSGGGTGGAEGAHRMKAYRADVLRFLPFRTGADGQPVGKRLVNDADLTTAGLAGHTIRLPDAGSGNAVPSTAGASLLVVYRDPSMPLKAIVVYDGGYTMDQSTDALLLPIQGFYQASNLSPNARMTHIVGDGQPNFSERVLFNGSVIATNPFTGALGPAGDPAWDNTTFNGLALPGGASSATISVDHDSFDPFDCLSWGAIVFSTTVQDTDYDGLLDVWETTSGVQDPSGHSLPDIHAMGANPNVQDLFVEIGYMTTGGYNTPLGAVSAHSHMPSDAVLNGIATVFHNAGPRNPAPGVTISGPINLHLDVGTNYGGSLPNANQCQANWQPACAIIPPSLARGGEAISEAPCVTSPEHPCQFPDYPGTVGWKEGFQTLRDEPLNFPDEASCSAAGLLCQRRFDENRKEFFKYGLYAHAIGVPRGIVDDPSTPIDERHTPRSISGVADGGYGGGDFMITLGFWGNNFTGTEFAQIATTVHEMGHTTGLKHGGAPATLVMPSPNCKSNYESVMNYLFQIRGLIGPNGPVVDFSRQVLNPLNESSLTETALTASGSPMLYPTRWYAPLSSSILDQLINTTPASKHCNGSSLTSADTVPTIRVDGTSTGPIDWNANGLVYPQDLQTLAQDINYNGTINHATQDGVFTGFDDWLHMDLRHTASRVNMARLSLEIEFQDAGEGDSVDFGEGDSVDFGEGDSVDFGEGDSVDFGKDLDFDTATSVGNPPNHLTYTTTKSSIDLSWDPPHAGAVTQYQVWRATGAITATNLPVKIFSTTQPVPPTTYSDTSSRNNVLYSYFVTVTVGGKQSGPSNIILASR